MPVDEQPPPSLKGKVILYDFWDYTCINCIRTFPHLNEIYRKYKNKGLVIIGIHSPEFDFAARPKRVERGGLFVHGHRPILRFHRGREERKRSRKW